MIRTVRIRQGRAPGQTAVGLLGVCITVLTLNGCGPSEETTSKETVVSPTKEMLFQTGHRLYLQQHYDSAVVVLARALALDAQYKDALADLASLYYDRAAMTVDRKEEFLRKAREYYVRLEALGATESDTYERLCEISDALNDHKAFLIYAQKNARLYPYDRQYYNLCVAYFNVGDYQSAIKLCKEAIEKFFASAFIGTFYRQLGRAYMKVDRDQTAEKTFYAGLGVIENRMDELRRRDGDEAASSAYQRLKDDAVGILISLKYLHTTYKAADKLSAVERKLRKLGR